MKQNNQSLDDFLRHNVEEADFSMKEDYWQKMSVLLDEEEKKKKRFFFWRGLSVLALLIVAGAGAYLFPKLSHKESAAASQHQTLPQTQQTVLPSVKQDQPDIKQDPQPETDQTTDEPTTTSSTTKTNQTSSSNNQTSTTQEKSSALLTDNESNEHKRTSKKEISNEKTVTPSTSKPVTSARAAHGIERKERKLARREQRKNDESVTNDATAKEAPSSSNANTNLTVVTPKKAFTKKKVVNENKIAKTDSKPAVTEKKSDPVPQSPVNVPVKGKNMKPVDTVQYVKRQPVDQSMYNPRYIGCLANYIPERLDSVTVITYQPVPEVKQAEQKPVETPKEKFKKPPFELVLLAGLNMNKGFKGNVSAPLSWGFSPYLGAGIDKQMTPKLTMSSHVGFTYFNGLNSQVKVNSYQYTFGLDSSAFSVAHKKLLQFYLPFSVYYQLFNNHFVMASLGMSYSFDVSSKVTTTTSSSNAGAPAPSTKSVTTSSSTQTGYRTGFNQFDVFAQFGYGYRVANRIMIQAAVQQGFFDMTKNSYFSNSVTNTQTRFSLGLKYNFKRN